ncbi:LacI family DNA-binding transcriptional regulator [Kineosporia sp. NBRC 101731]|uniref:LacI family DNA-binding transcriptional regulator n=1 Tax=Kineosporia sp. NBRC 101731 TaxID=3032199 RepID=UPI0024A1AA9F|nr:LacI family DNA-binding transcriptional regulator [Kineosporia sp. NBRC 101731]GLY29453.1 LacI family transcriptional regulator [Kineosporia sp. NBRC 101731]
MRDLDRSSGGVALVTLADVAALAGVSLATASRALNGSKNRRVADDLRERVLEAARRLDYAPNPNAQAVARGRTDSVGLVMHDIADPYFSSIAAGVIKGAEDQGLAVTIATTGRRAGAELESVARLRRQRARAIVLVGSRTSDQVATARLIEEFEAYIEAGGRVAAITQPVLPVDTLAIENRAGAQALSQALVELGHQEFAVLAGDPAMLTSQDRLAGFRDGLRRSGTRLARENVLRAAFTRDGGYEAMQRLIARAPAVSCVFAVNDVMAVGAMAALREAGLVAGRDVAIAGFDDIETLRDVTPALSTVGVPLQELGERAVELALRESGTPVETIRVTGHVQLRESTPRADGRTLASALIER